MRFSVLWVAWQVPHLAASLSNIMTLFDPNQVLPDFEQQTIEAQRQRRMADYLRKQQMEQPSGQVVGRTLVQPHWLERLVPLLNQYQAGAADRRATDAEVNASNQQNQAANQWRNSLPQATPSIPGAPGVDGPDGTPGGMPQVPVPAVPVDRARILKYTLAGMNNPRTVQEATLANTSLTSELQRQEDQTYKTEERQSQDRWRTQESELARVARADEGKANRQGQMETKLLSLQQQQQHLDVMSQNAQLSREQALAIAKMQDATRRQMGAASNELRQILAENRIDNKGAAAATAQDKFDFTQEKEMTRRAEHYGTVTKDLVPLHQSMNAVQMNLDKYGNDPKKVPGLGYSLLLPSVSQKAEANRVQRQFRDFSNSVMRGDAGLSQTLSEQANVLMQNMATGKFSTKEFVENWPEIMAKYNAKIRAANGIAGPDVLKKIGEQGGYVLNEVAAKQRSALPKATMEQMPEGMDPARWTRLQELRKNAVEGNK